MKKDNHTTIYTADGAQVDARPAEDDALARFEAVTEPEPEEKEAPAEADEALEESEKAGGNWPGDCGTLSMPLRRVLVTLLKGPYLYREKRKEAWNLLVNNLPVFREQLANLLLDLVIDDEVGVAFVRCPDLGDVQAPSLLNKYTFRFLDSVLLIEMRDRLMRAQQHGDRAAMQLDEINAHLAVFEPSAKKDSAAFANRVNAVLKRMKERHLLLEVGRGGDTWEISPVLKVVFDAAQVDALRKIYEEAAKAKQAAEDLVGGLEEDEPEDEAKQGEE